MRTTLLLILSLSPLFQVMAQWSFDVGSVEAYIADHKTQRSLLIARATLEQSNRALHGYSSESANEYRELNFDLDNYTRAFDIIDMLYQSLRTSLNIYSTYNAVSDRISDCKKMLNDYNELVLKHNKMELSDTIIIRISERGIKQILSESENLYKSISDLLLYATGAAACSTSDLMIILNGVNETLDNIKRHLNAAYYDTWRYIQLRIGYRKEYLYIPKSRSSLINDAFLRWRNSGLNTYK